MTTPNNVHIIADTGHDGITGVIDHLTEEYGIEVIHATNGTYAAPAEMVGPTLLGGFQYVAENVAGHNDAFVVFINSDASMQALTASSGNSTYAEAEDQYTRIAKVAKVLGEQFPNRQIFIGMYDEETPTDLYAYLRDCSEVHLGSLHKFGYGTKPDAPRIEGAESFDAVYGFPFPNDAKPLCHDITDVEDQTDTVVTAKLTEEIGEHGAPYMTTGNKVLFPVPASLANHAAPSAGGGNGLAIKHQPG